VSQTKHGWSPKVKRFAPKNFGLVTPLLHRTALSFAVFNPMHRHHTYSNWRVFQDFVVAAKTKNN